MTTSTNNKTALNPIMTTPTNSKAILIPRSSPIAVPPKKEVVQEPPSFNSMATYFGQVIHEYDLYRDKFDDEAPMSPVQKATSAVNKALQQRPNSWS